MNIIECINLTHKYNNKTIFSNMNFNVEKGKILGLLGKNGTGKSTTINIMNGFLKPTSGKCLIYGENTQQLSPKTKAKIGFLIEGHIQYSFMTIKQIEKFYSRFYPNWEKEPYWELMSKLNVAPKQKISTMSYGQRSQIALGLILAQDPDLLILDDFSMGLDPGYRRLFVEYLRDYAKTKNKTIFTTSHIIQDMEKLIDDVIIIDYNKVITHQSINNLTNSFKQFTINTPNNNFTLPHSNLLINAEVKHQSIECYSFCNKQEIESILNNNNFIFNSISEKQLNLEDIFIGLTGKY